MTGETIVVADDEKNIAHLIKMYLSKEGYNVETAADGEEALDKVRRYNPVLVVLDLMMPKIDGWEVCRQIRQKGNIPIIMLTARADDVDKIVGLELGADDYVTKPFNPRELVARVKAVLRRSEVGGKVPSIVRAGDLEIDADKREARVATGPLELRPKEFDLLLALAKSPGTVWSRERLLNTVWGYEFAGDSRTVDVHVAWLREKLGKSSAHIATVWSVGYKLIVGEP